MATDYYPRIEQDQKFQEIEKKINSIQFEGRKPFNSTAGAIAFYTTPGNEPAAPIYFDVSTGNAGSGIYIYDPVAETATFDRSFGLSEADKAETIAADQEGKVADAALTFKEIQAVAKIGSATKNKFDKAGKLDNFTINGSSVSNLERTASSGKSTTGLIKTEPSTAYIIIDTFNHTDKTNFLWYGSKKDKADGFGTLTRIGSTNNYTFSTPALSEYVEFSVGSTATNVDSLMVTPGSVVIPYENYEPFLREIGASQMPTPEISSKTIGRILDIYQDRKQIEITGRTAGRWDGVKTYSLADTNASYERSGKLPLKEYETVFLEFTANANAKNIAFDIAGNPLAEIPTNTNFVLPKGTDFIAISNITSVLNAKVYRIESVKKELFNEIQRKEPVINRSGNIFNRQLLKFSQLFSTGVIGSSGNKSTTAMQEVEPETEYYLYGSIFNDGQGRNFCFWQSDGTFIDASLNFVSADYSATKKSPNLPNNLIKITTPALAKYLRFEFHAGDTTQTAGIENFKIIKASDWEVINNDEERFRSENTYSDIKREISMVTKQVPNYYNKNILVFGDSISAVGVLANKNGAGWVREVTQLLRPKNFYNYANGGWKLTDTSSSFESGYLTTGENSFIKELEQFISDYNGGAGTVEAPDVIMIMGCVNDTDTAPTRYTTTAEIGTTDRDTYLETQFFTDSATASYNTVTLKELSTINRGKIVGALRYIVQRAGTVFPNTKFIIATSTQTTANTVNNQMKCRKDMIWAAERMGIPLIDQWGKGGLPTFWDYQTPGRYLFDKVHPYQDGSNILYSAQIMGRFVVNEMIKLFAYK